MIFNANRALKTLILFVFVSFAATFSIFPLSAEASFKDTQNSWARAEIIQLETIGVLSGYNDGTFKPLREISRAEFTKMIMYAIGENHEAYLLTGANSNFVDIPNTYWGKGYILLAHEMGIINGRGNNRFDPQATITREEAAAIVVRAMGVLEDDLQELEFNDRKDISGWAVNEIKTATSLGIITGFPDNSFRPKGILSREQAAAILARVMDNEGLLYQFNGVIREVDSAKVTIRIGGRNQVFNLANRPVFVDKDQMVNTLKDKVNTRISFNINSQGEIISGLLHYEDRYFDVNMSQMEDIGITAYVKPESQISLLNNTWHEPQSLSASNPGLSLETSRSISRVTELTNEYNLSGQGVTIAIIDTGIDPLHQDLQRTELNSRKIIDWVNFSDEGRVRIPYTLTAARNQEKANTIAGEITLPKNIRSVSGTYRYGIWYEDWIAFVHDIDFTGSGKTEDRIIVLLVDSKEAGIYDTVFVDTNGNMNLTDEVPLKVYRDNKHSYASFSASSKLPYGFPFVLANISPDGSEVSFGYDSDGHGTHVAGIVAGNGSVKGVATNAQLIAIKVVDSAGMTSEDKILQAVDYAVRNGADIINISLGHYPTTNTGFDNLAQRINEHARNRLVTIAVGNNGPGLGTLATPGDAANVLSVGAYIAPDMWEVDYGWRTENESLWYFNSIGPRADGLLKPDILAPGSAVSTFPTWMGIRYYLNEGTSMAAPFVSGTAALLMEGMWIQGKPVNSLMIKNALIDGARKLDNKTLVEQGHGVLDGLSAWSAIQEYKGLPNPAGIEMKTNLNGAGSGVFIREYLPGINQTQITNNRRQSVTIEWESQADWISINRNTTQIPASGYRNIEMNYTIPTQPGLYTGLIQGNLVNHNQKVSLLSTVIVPHKFNSKGEYMSYDSLPAGEMKRYYLQIPENSNNLYLKLKIMGTLDNLQGRARLHIYRPNGMLYQVTPYAGVSPPNVTEQREIDVNIIKPEAGIWEVVVYSSSTLSLYEKTTSDYLFVSEIKANQTNIGFVDKQFIIGSALRRDVPAPDTILLNIIEQASKKAYTGTLLINDKLYYVNEGKVEVHTNIERDTLTFKIRKVTHR